MERSGTRQAQRLAGAVTAAAALYLAAYLVIRGWYGVPEGSGYGTYTQLDGALGSRVAILACFPGACLDHLVTGRETVHHDEDGHRRHVETWTGLLRALGPR
jgi:hypothetical protein